MSISKNIKHFNKSFGKPMQVQDAQTGDSRVIKVNFSVLARTCLP